MKCAFIVCVFASVLYFSLSVSSEAEVQMIYLGKVGQKTFFSSQNTSAMMNAWEAGGECAKYGYKLATIDTAEESTYFESTIKRLLGGSHWVNAELDRWNGSIFKWGPGGRVESFVNYYADSNQPRICLYWFSVYNSFSQGFCDSQMAYALCQLVS